MTNVGSRPPGRTPSIYTAYYRARSGPQVGPVRDGGGPGGSLDGSWSDWSRTGKSEYRVLVMTFSTIDGGSPMSHVEFKI